MKTILKLALLSLALTTTSIIAKDVDVKTLTKLYKEKTVEPIHMHVRCANWSYHLGQGERAKAHGDQYAPYVTKGAESYHWGVADGFRFQLAGNFQITVADASIFLYNFNECNKLLPVFS